MIATTSPAARPWNEEVMVETWPRIPPQAARRAEDFSVAPKFFSVFSTSSATPAQVASFDRRIHVNHRHHVVVRNHHRLGVKIHLRQIAHYLWRDFPLAGEKETGMFSSDCKNESLFGTAEPARPRYIAHHWPGSPTNRRIHLKTGAERQQQAVGHILLATIPPTAPWCGPR